MRALPAALLEHLRGDMLGTALLWRIVKADGTEIRGTDHDRDLVIVADDDAAGTYLAGSNVTGSQLRQTSDLAVDNQEVEGALPSDETRTVDVNIREIEAGLFRGAEVWVYLCAWSDPSATFYAIKRGYLGDIARDTDGNYRTEIRGLAQRLAQTFVRTYSERCQVRDFGDTECGVDVAALEESGVVTSVTSRRRFNATISGGTAGDFSLGVLTMTSGENAGYRREIKSDSFEGTLGQIALWDLLPRTVQVGDTFTIRPGCDRRLSTCRDTFDNVLNFRGYGVYIEGMDSLMRGPT